jgi:hypothetical protein
MSDELQLHFDILLPHEDPDPHYKPGKALFGLWPTFYTKIDGVKESTIEA